MSLSISCFQDTCGKCCMNEGRPAITCSLSTYCFLTFNFSQDSIQAFEFSGEHVKDAGSQALP